MSVTVLSSDTANNAASNSVTAGSGLGGVTVGNLLVAQYIFNDTNGATTITKPSAGWTLIDRTARGGSLGATSAIYWKTADSGDASSPSFTFSASAGSKARLAVVKIQAGRISSPIGSSANNQSASNPIIASTVTPSVADSLLLFFTTTVDNTSVSGYTIPTSDPTWTESYDGFVNSSAFSSSMAYASRPETTATGTPSATGSSSSDNIGQIVVILGQYTATNSETSTATDTFFKTLNKVYLEVTTTTDILVTLAQRLWSTVTKNVSSWINTDKS